MPEISINSETKVITVRHEGGGADHFHTDPEEAREWFRLSQALNAGAPLLGLLLYGHEGGEFAERLQADGRTAVQLVNAWLRAVVEAGAHPLEAEEFLRDRLTRGGVSWPED